MAWSLIASGTSHGSPAIDSIDTTGAKLIVASVAAQAPATTFHDQFPNVYTLLTERFNSDGQYQRLFYIIDPITSASHAFAGVGFKASISFVAFGAAAVSFGSESAGGFASADTPGNSATMQPGSLVIPSANCLAVTGMNGDDGNTISIDSSFSAIASDADTFPFGSANGIAWRVLGAGAINPTWSFTNGGNGGACSSAYFTEPAPTIDYSFGVVASQGYTPGSRVAQGYIAGSRAGQGR